MREIIELNRQILAELPESITEDMLPMIDSDDGPELWPEASPALMQAARVVHAELRKHIPRGFRIQCLSWTTGAELNP